MMTKSIRSFAGGELGKPSRYPMGALAPKRGAIFSSIFDLKLTATWPSSGQSSG